MAFIYTQAQLLSAINRGIQGKKGLLISTDDLLNEVVREVKTEIKLRSAKRRGALVPNLFSNEFEYTCPSDLEGQDIIDVPQQARREDGEFSLIPVEQFLRAARLGDIAVHDHDGIRTLLIKSRVSSDTVVIDPLESLSASGGTWIALGGATNVDVNSDDYIRGNASIEFDIGATSNTTAGIALMTPTEKEDLSGYIGHSAGVFVNARLTSALLITNIKLRLGSDSSNYYEFTVTARMDGTAFAAGWNLLMFDMTSYTTVGSPDATEIGFREIYMTKSTSKVSEAGYMFNYLVAKKGKYADVLYYSKYGWTTAAGVYIENSTSTTDLLVADTDEFDLFVKKGRALAAREADLPENEIGRRDSDYDKAKANYQMLNPAEHKYMLSSYYDFGDQQGYGLNDHGDGFPAS